jgi:hypothetical protein
MASFYDVSIVQTNPTRFVMALIICVSLAVSSVFAASARGARTELLVHFVLPGGDTECLMVDPNLLIGNVTCAIHRHRFKCVGLTCDEENGYSRRWFVDVAQVAIVDRSRRPFGSSSIRVLRSGRSLTVGYFRCVSGAAGLTCLSRRSGHGFFLSKDNKRQRLF